jgi:hypothetical protein
VLIVLLAAMLVAVGRAKLVRHNKEACALQNGTPALHGCSDAVSGKLRFSISPLVAVYVEATNGFDLERWMAAFAHEALVNVEPQAYCEKPASSECAKRDIIGGRLTMNVGIMINHLGTSLWRPGWTVIAMSAAYLIRRRSPFMSGPQSGLIFQLIIFCNRSGI